ncbi:hypothetical protein FXO37_13819 [Capsicum annuum]|nr:hypothetical protein FXO37_13819 [Capsicum annuum]
MINICVNYILSELPNFLGGGCTCENNGDCLRLDKGSWRTLKTSMKLGEGLKGVYISVDLDCMDPAFAPEVSHIEPGGLSFCDVLNILYNLQADVDGADVVKFNPQRDTVDGMTAVVAAKLVRKLTAKISK